MGPHTCFTVRHTFYKDNTHFMRKKTEEAPAVKKWNALMSRSNSYYFRMLIGFASICACVIVLACLSLGAFFFDMLHQVTINYNTELLGNSRALIDQMLEHVNGNVLQLSINQTALKYMNGQIPVDYDELTRLQSLLADMCMANDYTDSIYIVCPERDRVVSSYGFYAYQTFHDRTWQESADASERSVIWLGKHTILKDKLTRVTADVITLVCRVPFYGKESRGYVVYNIRESYIADLLGRTRPGLFGIMLLMDPCGSVVSASADPATSIDYQKALDVLKTQDLARLSETASLGRWTSMTTLQRSQINDWLFVTYTPFQDLMRGTLSIVVMVVAISIVLIALSSLIIRRFSGRLYQPVEELLHCAATPDDEPETAALDRYTEFSQIRSSMRGIIEDKNQLSEMLDSFKPTLTARFFISLLHGNVQKSAATAQYIDFLGIDTLHASQFAVYVIVLSPEVMDSTSLEQQALYRISIRDFARTQAQQAGYFCYAVQMASGQIVVTVGMQNTENVPLAVFTLCSEVSAYVDAKLSLSTAIGIGEPVDGLLEIGRSHDQAFEALNYAYAYEKNPIIFYASTQQTSLQYINPLTYERPLLSAVKSGNKEEIRLILAQLRSLVCTGMYPLSYTKHIFYGIMNIALLASQELPAREDGGLDVPALMQRILQSESFDEIYALVLDAYIQVANRFQQSSFDKTRRTADDILRFIHQNYYKDISLTDLSNTFLYTTTHLNNVLKATTQKTFYDLLTEVRIDKAKELLASTPYQVSEVGEKVGYFNVQSFIRMFKRVVGVTPGKYRENLSKSP